MGALEKKAKAEKSLRPGCGAYRRKWRDPEARNNEGWDFVLCVELQCVWGGVVLGYQEVSEGSPFSPVPYRPPLLLFFFCSIWV
jgi:hypothetical protein